MNHAITLFNDLLLVDLSHLTAMELFSLLRAELCSLEIAGWLTAGWLSFKKKFHQHQLYI